MGHITFIPKKTIFMRITKFIINDLIVILVIQIYFLSV